MIYIREKDLNEDDKSQNTRKKILQAAAEVFSEKGYDGARVDEIAARVKVNKAMLYYYFENKEKLFAALVEGFVDEIVDFKKKIIKDIDFNDKAQMDIYYEKMFSLMNKNKDILRIISIESFKSTSQDVTIFKIIHPFFESKSVRLKSKGLDSDKIEGVFVNSFFFGIMPFLAYLTMGDRWADFNHFEQEDVKKKFMEIFHMYHSMYHSQFDMYKLKKITD